MKKSGFISVLLILASSLYAADSTWDGGAGDHLWSSAVNWVGDVVPPAGNRIIMNTDDYVDYDLESLTINKLITGSASPDFPGATMNFSSGSITNGSYWIVANGAGQFATLNISGSANVRSRDLNIGQAGGFGMVYVSGGQFTSTGTSGVGVGLNIPYDTGSWGKLVISDGNVVTTLLTINDIGATSYIDISGNGMLRWIGDHRTEVNGYISNGWITAEDDSATPLVLFDGGSTMVLSPNNNEFLVKAWAPFPPNGSTVPSPNVKLTWAPGAYAVKHNVYFGTDAANLALVGNQIDVNNFQLPELLFGTQYYWRVDELDNDTQVWTGDLWSFTTRGLLYIEEYETYADDAAFNAAWTASGGAAINLNIAAPFQGTKSMKLVYNNAVAPYYSEASSTNIWQKDFTAFNLKALDVWYYGNAANAAEKMYVTLSDGTNSATVQNPNNISQSATWQIWNIAVSDFKAANPSLNLTNITGLQVGMGTKSAPVAGGAGTVYIDNIRLYTQRCLNQPIADLNGDCKVNFTDFAQMSLEWLADGMWPL
ncbi:MAG: hypothetical protein A2Y10_01105 [Planctomycetes bacterium GWF2_41_51]|nr:MAG: hypothetical protein A2Y10_01105 [Planctomycetes bacterium GWF2_41_51]HBG26544.1 hypothetical protein [Phycisphaerales bacterium]